MSALLGAGGGGLNPSGDLIVANTAHIGWSATLNTSSYDTAWARDAAGQIGQRNGANPQAYHIYNTYTDANNYERATIDWTTTANVLTMGTQKLGSGLTRDLQILIGGVIKLDHGITLAATWSTADDFKTSGNLSAGNNAFWVQASGAFSALLWNGGIWGWTPDGSASGSSVLDTGFARPAAALIDCNNGTAGGAAQLRLNGVTVANLPAASNTYKGARATVTDATQTLTAGIGTVVAGTGGNVVPVFCDGTNWRIG